MPISLRTSWLTAALCAAGLTITGQAQTPTASPGSTAPAPALAPAKPPAAADSDAESTQPKHERVMSDEVAASLATGMPKFNPPKPVEVKPEEDQPDLRETDKPKNKIIRLPKYVVKEPKPPVFRERDLRSKSGLTDLGLKSHPGLNIGNIGGLNRPTALLMYEEQERLDNMAELKNDAKDAKNSGDATGSQYILRENNRANYRPTDFGWNSDGGGK